MSRPQGVQASDRYPIDVVFVIDATESMSPFLDQVKGRVHDLEDELTRKLAEKGRGLESLAVRVVAFRDSRDHPSSAFELSDMFVLPDRRADFKKFVDSIQAKGGGDAPESGLEALYLAMRSPWRSTPRELKRRHIIVLFTDADAHLLDGTQIPIKYTQAMTPRSFSQLKGCWGPSESNQLMDQRAKRLVMFAPLQVEAQDESGNAIQQPTIWGRVADEFENSLMVSSRAGHGVQEVTWDEVLAGLVASV
jgi:hypothetical protein